MLAFLTLPVVAQEGRSAALTLTFEPVTPLIEHRDGWQLLNFDLAVSNGGKSTPRLAEIEMGVLDSAGHLVLRKTVNSNGLSPGIDVVAKPLLAPGETVDIFNPFYSLGDEVPIHKIDFVFRYLREDTAPEREKNRHRLPMDYDIEIGASVNPRDYLIKTNLILPLTGRVFIWDGHEFQAHHRRVPLDAAKVREMGIHANPNRFASDLVLIDEQGRMYRDSPYDKKNWLTYGAAIYAPGGGKVQASANNVPDNEFENKQIKEPKLPEGADADLGNYVLIDHGNGEFSVFPHMMPESVLVNAGDTVRQGQLIGRVGFSGDAIFPHVHYALFSGPDIHRFEGLPAYFTHLRRLLGTKVVDAQHGTVDSGDIVESTAKYQQGSPGLQ